MAEAIVKYTINQMRHVQRDSEKRECHFDTEKPMRSISRWTNNTASVADELNIQQRDHNLRLLIYKWKKTTSSPKMNSQ